MQKKSKQDHPDSELRHAAQDLHEAAFGYDGLYGDDFLKEVDRIAGMMVGVKSKRAPRVRRLKFLVGSGRHQKKRMAAVHLAI